MRISCAISVATVTVMLSRLSKVFTSSQPDSAVDHLARYFMGQIYRLLVKVQDAIRAYLGDTYRNYEKKTQLNSISIASRTHRVS